MSTEACKSREEARQPGCLSTDGLISIVVPACNEEPLLARSIQRLLGFLDTQAGCRFEVVIADNGSTDGTFEIARALAKTDARVHALHRPEKGRGGALKAAWLSSQACILAYMDADLSTDLNAFPSLVQPLINGDCDLAIGSRLLQPRLTTRCLKREILSRCYNRLLRLALGARFQDAQCGFKAITREAAQDLLPLVQNTNWFFDTELLVLAQRRGYRIHEIPVHWVENQQTHVRLLRTIIEDIRGIRRLRTEDMGSRLHLLQPAGTGSEETKSVLQFSTGAESDCSSEGLAATRNRYRAAPTTGTSSSKPRPKLP